MVLSLCRRFINGQKISVSLIILDSLIQLVSLFHVISLLLVSLVYIERSRPAATVSPPTTVAEELDNISESSENRLMPVFPE